MPPHLFPDLAALEGQERVAAFCDRLAALSADCGLPQTLRDMKITEDWLPKLAKDAMNQTRLLVNNPRPVNEADALAIYTAAF
jgi:alcohol dehydrogenase class IV